MCEIESLSEFCYPHLNDKYITNDSKEETKILPKLWVNQSREEQQHTLVSYPAYMDIWLSYPHRKILVWMEWQRNAIWPLLLSLKVNQLNDFRRVIDVNFTYCKTNHIDNNSPESFSSMNMICRYCPRRFRLYQHRLWARWMVLIVRRTWSLSLRC